MHTGLNVYTLNSMEHRLKLNSYQNGKESFSYIPTFNYEENISFERSWYKKNVVFLTWRMYLSVDIFKCRICKQKIFNVYILYNIVTFIKV